MSITHVNGPLPGPNSKRLLEEWHQYEADVTGFQAPTVWDSAKGCVVTDVDGNRFIDWTSGVLVTNVGHCHPDLVAAAQEATGKLLNNYECPNTYRVEAAKRLVNALPDHLDKCFFLSTGSEATEGASRLMKRRTGNYEIISFVGAFHGRTATAAAMGGLGGPKKNYGPAVPGVIRAPFPYPYRDPCGWCDDGPDFKRYFDFLEMTVSANSSGSLAGVIVEPYQGAAGFIFPPRGWLKRLEEWTHANGLLFTLDEVQSSYGRTGRMWALEHEDLKPDILTIGKAIGCGVPVSAIAATSDVFSCLAKGEMSSTLGGNPVASAAVPVILDIFEREGLVQRSAEMGAYMMPRLLGIAERSAHLGEVRGTGLVMGLEFVKDKDSRTPAPELIKPIITECANHGLLVGSVGIHSNVIRVAPPLVLTREEADESLDIMENVVLGLGE
ncbi:MAG: aspartate aminotransferase family protein [Lentisphaerae bacterium]|jgi:4-aminobutyrate aminotransferase / (S)-3-amino-2-methylpropionate transaminase / 5-aminovalerate transaminase|nr:aspartate aminotransferase family protein [Lentisphaerota bacterium]MBT4818244.1 aspartate aminotransferase family protein [Lentisphaerota bacterium]MBT5605356.1 aspartate aminotransferase family protein [Lentisphaerota bacterium]MBT7060361.1 aspartate aminotransferase family protein [Lentisphaerota bacterium]MBT7844785.1 aspartate aminotransferase family protein [Lentisphaerota bacterium]